MAVIGANNATIIDIAKRFSDDGALLQIAEILNQNNEFLEDMPMIEANMGLSHKTSVRTGLPSATWRLFYQGASQNKSTTAVVTDTCGMLETYSIIDRDLADINDNAKLFRRSEDVAFIEGMAQQAAQAVIYGSVASNPERIQGLSPRYNSLSAASGSNIINAGGSTNGQQTSFWLVVFGERTVHGLYPKGSKAGLQYEDVTTSQPIDDGSGGKYQAYQTKYQWKLGLSVRDWRYAVRVCNIDVPGLAGASPVNLQRLFIRAMNKVPNLKAGKACFIVNRAVRTWADIQQSEKPTLGFHMVEDAQGKPLLSFRGIPLRLCDQLLTTENVVS
jgi:hypothetical protein